jgi:hypothetical protein
MFLCIAQHPVSAVQQSCLLPVPARMKNMRTNQCVSCYGHPQIYWKSLLVSWRNVCVNWHAPKNYDCGRLLPQSHRIKTNKMYGHENGGSGEASIAIRERPLHSLGAFLLKQVVVLKLSVQAHINTYIHTYIVHTYVHAYIHTHTYMHIYTYINTYIHTYLVHYTRSDTTFPYIHYMEN